MKNKLYYHKYTLKSKGQLNVKSQFLLHHGVLLRIGNGFGCIHPWEVLGDEPLEVQLSELAAGRATRLGKKALACAKLDGEAREAGVSLFQGLAVPDSHATVVDAGENIGELVERGFTKIKLKAGADVEKDAAMVNEIAALFPQLKLRIDFNCHFSGSQVGDFIELLTEKTRSQIEFLEDPCSYKDGCWTGLRDLYGIRLAMDLGVETVDARYSYAVIKPAKNNAVKVAQNARAQGRRCVVTSYMDHPIGQAFAAYTAGVLDRDFMGVCDDAGLMTHGLFEQTEFSEILGDVKPSWPEMQGTGLGFDELLGSLKWTSLA